MEMILTVRLNQVSFKEQMAEIWYSQCFASVSFQNAASENFYRELMLNAHLV